MAAKVEIFVVPGKKLKTEQFPVIKRVLNGKSFPLVVPEAKLKSNDEVVSRGEVADMVVDLLKDKAPDLKQALKVIVKTSQFKTVPDDCVVTMEFDGAKDGDIKTTIKLDKVKARESDPTVRVGYKPTKLEGEFALEGEEFYGGANLRDMLIIANPSYSVTVRAIGPALAGATWGKLGTAAQFILDSAAKRIGVAAGKSAQALEKMVADQDGEGADKEITTLNKIVSAEVGKLQPTVQKTLEAQRGKLKGADPMIERCEFESAAVARFIKFMPAPDLQAMIAISGPSKNDKQVRPMTKDRKLLLAQLKDDMAERKSYAAGVRTFLISLRDNQPPAAVNKAQAAGKAFMDHLADIKAALEDMADVIAKVKKNNKAEQPKGKGVAKEDKVDWVAVMKETKRLETLMIGFVNRLTNAKGFADQVGAACEAAAGKGKMDGKAAALANVLPNIEKDGVDSGEMKKYRTWSQEILDYIKE